MLKVNVNAQEVYDDFESTPKVQYFVPKNWGQLDVGIANPAKDSVNQSEKCAGYKRSRQRYDYIKMYPNLKFTDVDQFASYDPGALKFTMKVYSTAPVGSLIEIQLGKKSGTAYPAGTHSQYQAITTVSGAWEVLEFKYSQTPKGSETSAKEVDQMTLMFLPGGNKQFQFFFDDVSGPVLTDSQSVKWFRKK